MFNGNAQLTGVSPYLGPTSAANARVVLTTAYTGSTPLITSDGTMYIIAGDREIHALANSGAGSEKWTYTLPSIAPHGSAAISSDGGKLYYYSDQLYAIDITTNPPTLAWSLVTGGNVNGAVIIGPDGVIYFNIDAGLKAVFPNGTLYWTAPVTGLYTFGTPAVAKDGSAIYSASNNNNFVYAFFPNGTLRWQAATGGYTHGLAVSPDGTLIVGSYDQNVYAFYPNGTQKWKFAANGAFEYSQPSVGVDGTVYIGCDCPTVYAIKADGTLRWTYSTGGGSVSAAALIAADGSVYVADYYRTVHAVNADGTQKWTYNVGTGYQCLAGPVLSASGHLYVLLNDGRLFEF